MAKAAEMTDVTEETTKAVGLVDDGTYQWETVHEEAPDQIVFEEVGDTYIGLYVGAEEIDPKDPKDPEKRFTQLRFRDQEGLKVTNAGYELREAFKEMPTNVVVRLVLMKFVDVDQNDPMKSFRVDVARNADNTR